MVTNLRDVIKERMKERGLSCRCLRCREAGHRPIADPKMVPQFFVDPYENAGGTEYFLSMEDPDRTTVFAFLRLRLPNEAFVDADPKTQKYLTEVKAAFPELRNTAIVRELHTYGQALRVQDTHTGAVQHKGYGRRLMQEAEKIAQAHGHPRIAVISGIGVRAYYRELGYRLQGTYMCKALKVY